MQVINIEKTHNTPKVVLDKTKGIFKIEGKSLPEDVMSFYGPIINWLHEYLANPNPTTVLTFEMHYFNTASSKIIYEIISMLKEPFKSGKDVRVNWCYLEDDDDTLEAGKDYESLSKVPFDFSVIIE